MINFEPKDPSSMARYAALRAFGLPADEMGRPLVAVLSACHPLQASAARTGEWALAAAQGVQSCGGNPVVFSLPGAASPAAFGDDLEWLNVAALAAEVERLAMDLCPDAMVLIADSEASLLALLRGAARSGLPVIAVPGDGCYFQDSGEGFQGLDWDYARGKISRDEWLLGLEDSLAGGGYGAASPSPFGFLVEALGLSLPGLALLEPGSPAKKDLARQSGWQAVTLANTGTRLPNLVTAAGLRNALAVDASLGGSACAVWALAQLAGELGLSLSGSWLKQVKPRAYVKPGLKGVPDLEPWRREGGLTGLQLLLWEAGLLDGSVKGVLRVSLKESLSEAALPAEPSAFYRHPGQPVPRRLSFITGPLLPKGALFEVPSGHEGGEWTARVFKREEDACAHILKYPGAQDEMILLHNQGRRVRGLAACLRASGAGCWVLSDGVISGQVPVPWGLRLPGKAMEPFKDGGRVKLDMKTGRLEAEAADKAPEEGLSGLAVLERERLGTFGFLEN